MYLLRKVDWPENLDYTKQGVEVPGTRRKGQTGHYVNGAFGLVTPDHPKAVTTINELFNTGLALSRNRPYLGHRPLESLTPQPKFAKEYVWKTYAQVDEERRAIGSAVHHLFQTGVVGGGDLDTIGMWSPNRPEWQILDLALQTYKKVGVSLYDTLGKDAVEYIINHAHVTIAFVSKQHLPSLLKISQKAPQLKVVVCFDPLQEESRRALEMWAEGLGIKVMDWPQLVALGKENIQEPIAATPDQIATLCYTSGTTSAPKGVVLSHCMLAMAAFANVHGTVLDPTSVLLSYLPLSHIYERVCELNTTLLGARIGYSTGDPLRLLEDAQILKPSFFPSVPRVLNRIYQSAMVAASAGGLKGALFNRAMTAKLHKLHTTGDNTHALWDRLVFSKIQAVLGGQLKVVITGSAPINKDVIDFLKIAFGGVVVEGFGMTENSACVSLCWPNDPSSSGTVGAPQPTNEIKLVDVPEMGYFATDIPDPRGEILTRGAVCFNSYYKDEENTLKTVDSEGWTHTGDVGAFDSCGRLRIIDRVKNIMKLAQGEYVALEKIQNIYSVCPIAAQLYVHGDGLQSFLVAVIVPDPLQFAPLASKALKEHIAPEDNQRLEEATKKPEVVDAVMKLLNREAQRHELRGFERIKRVHLTMTQFTVENNTLTPTMKLRRKDAYNLHKGAIDALFAAGEPGK